MLLILLASSSAGAENAAKALRRDGFLASVSVEADKPLVVVNCLKDDQYGVIRRAQIADAHAKPVICGLVTNMLQDRSIPVPAVS